MDDTLVTIRYPFADGDGSDGVSIATVRPATILADVAVAVHPDDPRYRDAIGREVIVPYTEQRVPVIADERIDREFGTGALKVTPGHDPLDFDIGRDHGLPEPMAVGWDGRMSEAAGDLAGLTQEEAGERVLAWAEERGLVEKREPYRHSVGTCERCHSRIEPLISLQWWCAMKRAGGARDRGAAASDASASTPSRSTASRSRRSRRRPTGASRGSSGGAISSRSGRARTATRPSGRRAVGLHGVRLGASSTRESDVLDTWFSSALWPFATLGWPDETPELARYYPGRRQLDGARDHPPLGEPDDLDGARGARRVPFTDVIIHSTVLAVDGRRMSKSLGTGHRSRWSRSRSTARTRRATAC